MHSELYNDVVAIKFKLFHLYTYFTNRGVVLNRRRSYKEWETLHEKCIIMTKFFAKVLAFSAFSIKTVACTLHNDTIKPLKYIGNCCSI